MKKLFSALALAALAAGAPALAEPGRGGGWVAKVDVLPVDGPLGFVPRQTSWDDGYFSYRGGGVDARRGQARFDYDRSYPYDFAFLPPEHDGDERVEERVPSCEDSPARGAGGRETIVRICRN